MPKVHRYSKAKAEPPDEMRLLTCDQVEEAHPAFNKQKLRTLISKADNGDPNFADFKAAIVRVGRSVFIDDVRFRAILSARRNLPPAPSRRG
jgi:hypothetical protein